MTLRIVPHRQFEIGQLRVRAQTGLTAQLRDQISSGIRIHRPSDDPRAQKLILNEQAAVSRFKAQALAIGEVRSLLNASSSNIQATQQLVVRARDIGLQSRQINDPAEAEAYAAEIDGILQSLQSIANSQYNEQYVFGGTQTQRPSYAGVAQKTDYQGGLQAGSVRIFGVGDLKTVYNGNAVFTTGADGQTLVQGSTGATAGTGTASGHGTSQLRVRHTSTSYSGTSGVAAGVSSPGGDTVIGQPGVHRVEIVDTSGTGASGTISLNGGATVAFSGSDTDLRVTGIHGEVIFVNMSSITPGFSGTVDLNSAGTLSLDGGITEVPIDFIGNQTLADESGNIRHIDSRGITRTGSDTVSLTGNADLFQTLRTMRDDFRSFAEFSAADWNKTVAGHLGSLELANTHLLSILGEQSVDLQMLDRVEQSSDQQQLESQKRLTELEGTDLTSAVLRLQEQQNLMQYSFATLSGVLQISVLDFLR